MCQEGRVDGGVFFITPHRLSRVPEQEFFPIFGGEYPNESCIRLELHLAMSDIIGKYCLQVQLGDGEVAARALKVDIGFCHVSLCPSHQLILYISGEAEEHSSIFSLGRSAALCP